MSWGGVELRAGPLRLALEGADLRDLDPGSGAVVQRVYPAFRDTDWRTAEVTVSGRQIDRGDGHFRVALEGTARLERLDLAWRAQAEGRADGTVVYALDARPRVSFVSRRLGVCVHLDAAACDGARALVEGAEGEGELTLGSLIAPQMIEGGEFRPMLGPFTRLALALPDGQTIRLATGETPFELEDQRNWADGSLKIYSTAPQLAQAHGPGDRVRQRLRLAFTGGTRPTRRPRPAAVLGIGEASALAVRPIGLTFSGSAEPAPGLAPSHLRVDVDLGSAELPNRAALDAAIARTGASVELAVNASPGDPPMLPAAIAELPIARVLALDRREESTSADLVDLVRRGVGDGFPIGVGTPGPFAEICRQPPVAAGAEILCWSVHPQYHASDDRSLIENLPGLAAQVLTARALLPGLAPVVSPLRIGPPGRADRRGSSAFGAAWAVGALAQLIAAGAHAITLAGDPGQEMVLAAAAVLMRARGAPLRPIHGGAPGFAALAWGEEEAGILIANLLPGERTVRLSLPAGFASVEASPVRPGGAGGEEREELSSRSGEVALRLSSHQALSLVARR